MGSNFPLYPPLSPHIPNYPTHHFFSSFLGSKDLKPTYRESTFSRVPRVKISPLIPTYPPPFFFFYYPFCFFAFLWKTDWTKMIRHLTPTPPNPISHRPIIIKKKNVTTCDHPTWLGPAAWAGCGTVGASGLQVWNGQIA